MSRIHDALRKAGQPGGEPQYAVPRRAVRNPIETPAEAAPPQAPPPVSSAVEVASPALPSLGNLLAHETSVAVAANDLENLDEIIRKAKHVPFEPASSGLLVNPANPREAPAEEFRSLRTRLNHFQRLQPLHTVVVTSGSPAEGKSFTACNLAITQSQLADSRILLADFDFRRPSIDKTFRIPGSPGITNYLTGKAGLADIITRVGDTNLYVMTAGDSVPNPLELLNLKETASLIQGLRENFDWVILDSPPLLFAADANLLSTMCDGTILVVRIGTTTFDSVTRALQSLCENNVLGVVVNGARRGELYSKYTYYHDYYYAADSPEEPAEEEPEAVAEAEETQ